MKRLLGVGLILINFNCFASTIYNSDGSSTDIIGNTAYNSDGSSSTAIGDTIYNSDGSSSTIMN